MLTIFEQLAQVKATGRTRDKLAMLKRYDSPTLRDALFFAVSPTVAFGVGRVKTDLDSPALTSPPSVGEFLALAQDLIERKAVGTQATDRVIAHAARYPALYRELVIDLFAGKLSIGCDAETVNKAFPGVIPVFGVQLAREFSTDHMTYPAFVSSKLDGMRCLLFVTYAGVSLLSRTGKSIVSLPHISAAFEKLALGVYDGELLHDNGVFADTVSICRKLEPPEGYESVRLHVFDYVPLHEWSKPTTPAKQRFLRLDEIYKKYLAEHDNSQDYSWFVVEHEVIRNNQELSRFHDLMIESGYEGTMIQFDRPYSQKRTHDLMKLKNFTSTEAVVIGIEPGAGKYKKVMGACHVRDTKSGVVFKCGSGFSDAERGMGDFWLDKIIEIKFQELTKDNVPRFPTFLRIRGDLT